MPTILSQPTDQIIPLTTTYAADIRKDILSAWDAKENPQSVVLDLGEVSRIDSAGVKRC